MLLPSAFSCDSSRSPPPPPLQFTRLQSPLFASPPASPPQLPTQAAIGNIFTTCLSLQSLLTSSTPFSEPATEPITPPTSSHAQLPTPPMAHAPSPMKLRLRARKMEAAAPEGDNPIRKRIVKRPAPPARGVNKRRRALDDDLGRDDGNDSDNDNDGAESDAETYYNKENEGAVEEAPNYTQQRPQTPKRARIAPAIVPLGLERSDYHGLHILNGAPRDESSQAGAAADGAGEAADDDEAWSTEDDRILVELVLEKLKLTKSDWQDCARSLGKDRHSIGRRWKSLILSGDVGIKRTSRRSKIHGTWR
ncbi:hypothetical protein B0T22DRAFT_99941 [Podospora appendiculata]|uniref:Myb-like domain-containing protein n=1 Tax=Podospora appendiculata TaxID=314037 RepID=A0AAE0XKS7_9PEZI|nr:hypothetical protein B0T22DRAFT_99941 [Podospora appendiculata]